MWHLFRRFHYREWTLCDWMWARILQQVSFCRFRCIIPFPNEVSRCPRQFVNFQCPVCKRYTAGTAQKLFVYTMPRGMQDLHPRRAQLYRRNGIHHELPLPQEILAVSALIGLMITTVTFVKVSNLCLRNVRRILDSMVVPPRPSQPKFRSGWEWMGTALLRAGIMTWWPRMWIFDEWAGEGGWIVRRSSCYTRGCVCGHFDDSFPVEAYSVICTSLRSFLNCVSFVNPMCIYSVYLDIM